MSDILKQQRKYLGKYIDVKPKNEGEIKQGHELLPLEELQHQIGNSRLYGIYNEMKPILEWTPGISDILDVNNVAENVSKGNYGKATIGAGLLMLPNAIEKPLKHVGKKSMTYLNKLNWSPEDWFKYRQGHGYTKADADALAKNVPEYEKIFNESVKNNTYLKNPDGSTFEGDPREWVMLQSKKGKDWKPVGYTGIQDSHIPTSHDYQGQAWVTDKKGIARGYTQRSRESMVEDPDKGILKLNIHKDDFKNRYEAFPGDKVRVPNDLPYTRLGDYIGDNKPTLAYLRENFPDNFTEYLQGTPIQNGRRMRPNIDMNTGLAYPTWTDEVARNLGKKHKSVYFPNMSDGHSVSRKGDVDSDAITNTTIISEGTPRKSILGNTGDFNINDKNIYRSAAPLVTGGLGYSLLRHKEENK